MQLAELMKTVERQQKLIALLLEGESDEILSIYAEYLDLLESEECVS